MMDIDYNGTGSEVAVIGMACRFPGANNIDDFWDNLKYGIESLTFFSDKELEEAGVEPELIRHPDYVKAKGVMEDLEYFDAAFFGYLPVEATLMDPQTRIFHESAWHALEDAGYNPDTYKGLIGVYAGASSSFDWGCLLLLSEVWETVEGYNAALLRSKDFLCTYLAYKLNLKGPSLVLQSACSTSLAAIHSAVQALLNGECDMALAGGIAVSLPQRKGYLYKEGMVASPDGHCRAFDAAAQGAIFGEGVGVVVLKRFEEAVADRDHIYAVIKGTAINNDGVRKVGFAAPSVEGQAEVIRTALQMAEVEPETIRYIEAHGTGTPLGDPVEIDALKLAFNNGENGGCGIGSVKTNLGHLDTAAGVASFIKTVLALKHKLIPPSLHFKTPNPRSDMKNTPFYVVAKPTPWENNGCPLRAGVSSFGIGGTNVHMILEETPDDYGRQSASPSRERQLLVLSARTNTALDCAAKELAGHLNKNPLTNLADAAYTLQVGRKAFAHRRIVVGSSVAEVADALLTMEPRNVQDFGAGDEDRPAVFMFSGQGSQYVNMGWGLYRGEPVFRNMMDRCFSILESLMGENVKHVLYPGNGKTGSTAPNENPQEALLQRRLDQMIYSGPLKFALEYCLATLLMEWGIQPYAMIGHSFGEYVAACLSGVFSLEDALKIAIVRGQLMHQMPEGAMTSVSLSEDELSPLLNDRLSLAAVNSPASCIVSGDTAAIEALEDRLNRGEIEYIRLKVPRAGHSKMVEPIRPDFERAVAGITLKPPKIPYVSGITGQWITPRDATDPAYWGRHLKGPIRFSDGLAVLLKETNAIFVEVGPGRGLTSFVNQHLQKTPEHLTINFVRHKKEKMSDGEYLLQKIGEFWLYGKDIRWDRFYAAEKRRRISLPPYSFERQRYWIETDQSGLPVQKPAHQTLSKKGDISRWFYFPSWECTILPPAPGDVLLPGCWLVFLDDLGLGQRLAEVLEQRGVKVIKVRTGTGFKKVNHYLYEITPDSGEEYFQLFHELAAQSNTPSRVIHLWGMNKGDREKIQELGFYSLIYLARVLGKMDTTSTVEINVVTEGVQEVTGQEILQPERSTVLGPCRVIPQEYPHIVCRSIDISVAPTDSRDYQKLAAQLLREFTESTAGSRDLVVAYRGHHRWVQIFKPFYLESLPFPGRRFRTKGLYLISGGTGQVGLTLARHLSEQYQARLILTGQSPFPDRTEWEKWLRDHDEEDQVSQKIRTLQQLESLGGEILVFSADAADPEQMGRAIQQGEQRFGPLNGVIHAAGTTDPRTFRSIDEIEESDCIRQFRPKVEGLLTLETVLTGKKLDFCVLTSSLSAILGGLGHVAYAAANLYMDAYVRKHNQDCPVPWISVDWDVWHFGADDNPSSSIGSSLRELAIRPAEGIQVFERVLTLNDLDQVVISTGELRVRIEQWVELDSLRREETGKRDAAVTLGVRPKLQSPYLAPAHPLEHQLVDIWQQFFGIEPVGVQDDFFELGGDSLKAVTVTGLIHKKLNAKVPLPEFFDNPTPRAIARLIAGIRQDTFSSIKPAELKEYYPLSSAQKRMYILQQIDAESTIYNILSVLIVEGDLCQDRLAKALNGLIQRHESLRTSFHMIDGEVVQVIHPLPLFQIHTSQSGEDKIKTAIERFIRPFDLKEAPLLRTSLVKLSNRRHLLVTDMHHIVADGVSIDIFIREFIELYEGGEPPVLKVQYKDFVLWHNHQKDREAEKRQQDYWLQLFSNEPPVIHLPLDYPRPEVQRFEGSSLSFMIKKSEADSLLSLAKAGEATLFMVLLATLNVLLMKLSGQEDIVIGTPVAGRRHPDLEPLIGVFINTLALRNYPGRDKSFSTFLKELKHTTLRGFENQDYPFEDLVDKVVKERDLGHHPLFDVMFILHNEIQFNRKLDIQAGQLKLESYKYEDKRSQFDLTFTCIDLDEGLAFETEYNTNLFNEASIRRFTGYFEAIIRSVLKGQDQPLAGIDILSTAEKTRLLYHFNDTQTEYPGHKTIHRLFEEQVERTPYLTALTEGRQAVSLTYSELSKTSAQLAAMLRERGVLPGSIIAVMVRRSLNMVAALLGILRADAAYLPLDPEYPQARIRYILEHSGTAIVVTAKNLMEKGETVKQLAGEIVFLDDFIVPGSSAGFSPSHWTNFSNLAYVIYTSGSTGNPKGVVVRHQNAVNFIQAMTGRISFSPGSTILALTTLSFDIFFLETLLPVCRGLRVVIADEYAQRDPQALSRLIQIHCIDLLQVTPSRLQLLVNFDMDLTCLARVSTLVVGGEAFPAQLAAIVKKAFAGEIYNVYGPTETTVWSTVKALTDGGNEKITIGCPIANTQVYVVNREMQLLPLGAAGELLIGGDGVAEGYLNNPELTAEQFVNERILSPRSPILYRTGDLSRWLPNGEMEFLGRIDHQVKIRGFRIEIGEIEEQLHRYKAIKEVVVVARENQKGDKYLAAYYVKSSGVEEGQNGEGIPVSSLQEFLSHSLPEYMIPSFFVQLEKIPLTPNGKVNRRALPDPGESFPHLDVPYEESKSPMEKMIAGIWEAELGLERVGVNDDFFSIGGNSLEVVKVNNRLRESLKMDISVISQFKYRTIRSLALHLSQQETSPQGTVNDRSRALARGEKDRLKRLQMRRGVAR